MPHSAIARAVEPFSPSAISYFRTRLRCGLTDAVTAPRIAPAQALLLFSLAYGAGASVEELARMRLEFLLDADGKPAPEVRFDHSVTKHRTTRGVAMHPDIAADLSAFRHFFPQERWVAFRPAGFAANSREHLPASTITRWFRSCLREAGLGRFTMASARKAFLVNQRAAAR
jgi:integrase